ncbi:hypothetical protein AGMMS49957_02290 [Synergistales bacterium]|nr:hypothetical protein AGMMS49957_02290 [Synergistales bacterium]
MSFPVFNLENVSRLLPPRPLDMNKEARARVLVAGGSENYPGAAILASLSALRSGGGVVSLLSLPLVCQACASRLPEAVQLPTSRASWTDAALAEAPRANAAVAGPGLGRSNGAVAFAQALWEKWDKPLLMDGDALYALAVRGEELLLRKDAVLTPHEGEAARLLSWSVDEVRRDRAAAAERLARRWGCVLLKGRDTLVMSVGADGERTALLNHGGPELSVPGSGDVLSGCIGAFLAQGLSPFDAACVGGALHGMAGRRLRDRKGVDGILASEIADELPFALRSCKIMEGVV